MSRDANLKKLIELRQRRLFQLQKQQAVFGTSTPPEVSLEIEDIEVEIQKLAAELGDAPPPTTYEQGFKVSGDVVFGDKVSGDMVAGDKITLSEASGTAGVIGRDAQQIVRQSDKGLSADSLSMLFFPVYGAIQTRAEDPDVEKNELTRQVEKIERELSKGDEADPNRIYRLLDILHTMARDVFETTATALSDRSAPVPGAVRKVTIKAQEILE